MSSRTLAALLPLSFVALTSLHCGGKTDTSLLPECPSNGTCASDCKQTVTDCEGPHELACTCDGTGHAQCPELGAPNCQDDCSALLHGQSTCSIEGERCLAPAQLACIDAPTLYCTCASGQFVCDAPPDCPPPPPPCPPPDQVKPGASCSTFGMCPTNQTITDCDGNVIGVVECNCSGGTIGDCVAPAPPPCAMDGGAAPDGWK